MQRMLIAAVLLLFVGCNNEQGSGEQEPAETLDTQEPKLKIALLLTDLGLGDGNWVRECNEVLDSLDRTGQVEYLPVGKLPKKLVAEAGATDIGLPSTSNLRPGEMSLDVAVEMLAEVPECDWLVLSSPRLVDAALSQIKAGSLKAGALVVMDEQGWTGPPLDPVVPLVAFRYDIRHVAFLNGVAAAASSVNGHIMVLVADNDAQADEFLKAASAGAKYMKNGAWIEPVHLPVDEDGLVSPEGFSEAMTIALNEGGEYFKSTDYIVAAGRTTPALMYALCSAPWNGYVHGAYADYCSLRPAKVVGCSLKKPAAALSWLISQHAMGASLSELAPTGQLEVGLAQNAVGFTSFELYKTYNPDGVDIEQATNDAFGLIQYEELGIDY